MGLFLELSIGECLAAECISQLLSIEYLEWSCWVFSSRWGDEGVSKGVQHMSPVWMFQIGPGSSFIFSGPGFPLWYWF